MHTRYVPNELRRSLEADGGMHRLWRSDTPNSVSYSRRRNGMGLIMREQTTIILCALTKVSLAVLTFSTGEFHV